MHGLSVNTRVIALRRHATAGWSTRPGENALELGDLAYLVGPNDELTRCCAGRARQWAPKSSTRMSGSLRGVA